MRILSCFPSRSLKQQETKPASIAEPEKMDKKPASIRSAEEKEIAPRYEYEAAPQYEENECNHNSAKDTPALKSLLEDSRTQACIVELRDILSGLVSDKNGHNDACIKCAVTKSVSTVATFAGQMRDSKRSGDWTKAERKAMKKEVKSVAKGFKRDSWPALKKSLEKKH